MLQEKAHVHNVLLVMYLIYSHIMIHVCHAQTIFFHMMDKNFVHRVQLVIQPISLFQMVLLQMRAIHVQLECILIFLIPIVVNIVRQDLFQINQVGLFVWNVQHML